MKILRESVSKRDDVLRRCKENVHKENFGNFIASRRERFSFYLLETSAFWLVLHRHRCREMHKIFMRTRSHCAAGEIWNFTACLEYQSNIGVSTILLFLYLFRSFFLPDAAACIRRSTANDAEGAIRKQAFHFVSIERAKLRSFCVIRSLSFSFPFFFGFIFFLKLFKVFFYSRGKRAKYHNADI